MKQFGIHRESSHPSTDILLFVKTHYCLLKLITKTNTFTVR